MAKKNKTSALHAYVIIGLAAGFVAASIYTISPSLTVSTSIAASEYFPNNANCTPVGAASRFSSIAVAETGGTATTDGVKKAIWIAIDGLVGNMDLVSGDTISDPVIYTDGKAVGIDKFGTCYLSTSEPSRIYAALDVSLSPANYGLVPINPSPIKTFTAVYSASLQSNAKIFNVFDMGSLEFGKALIATRSQGTTAGAFFVVPAQRNGLPSKLKVEDKFGTPIPGAEVVITAPKKSTGLQAIDLGRGITNANGEVSVYLNDFAGTWFESLPITVTATYIPNGKFLKKNIAMSAIGNLIMHLKNVSITPPTASFTAFDSVIAGQNVKFNASASRAPGSIITAFDWDFGDGRGDRVGNKITHFTFPIGDQSIMTYNVELTIVTRDGLFATSTKPITVRNP